MADSVLGLALEEITRATRDQQSALESLRNRATALISVGAVVFALLQGSLTGGRTDWATWVALGAVAVVGFAALVVLFPMKFIFHNDVEKLVGQVDADPTVSLASVQREWALWGSRNYTRNEAKLQCLFWCYEAGLGGLLVEMVALGVHLTR